MRRRLGYGSSSGGRGRSPGGRLVWESYRPESPLSRCSSGHTCCIRLLRTDEAARSAARRLPAELAAAGLGRAVAVYFREPGFAGMTFSDLGRNPPGQIVADDLLAVALLDITWRPQVVRILLGGDGQRLSAMLAAIPQDTDLWDAGDDTLGRIDVLWDALTAIEGIGTASATKLGLSWLQGCEARL